VAVDRAPEQRLFRLMRTQHGVASRGQAAELGVTPRRLATLLEHGYIQRVGRGVYLNIAWLRTWETDVMAACLCVAGAVASHGTAAALHSETSGGRRPPASLDVMIPARGRVPPAKVFGRRIVVHLTRYLPQQERCRVGAIPATTPARTLLDVAATKPRGQLDETLEELLAAKRVHSRAVERLLQDPRHRRVRGAPALNDALDRATLLHVELTESVAERRFLRLVVGAGLPPPAPQLEVRGPKGGFIGRVDFAWPEAQVIAEVDGSRWHSSLAARRKDTTRDLRLAASGWRVLRFTPSDIETRRQEVLATVAQALAAGPGNGQPGAGRRLPEVRGALR
jgi:predicted transcriptional regulator of viral defense system